MLYLKAGGLIGLGGYLPVLPSGFPNWLSALPSPPSLLLRDIGDSQWRTEDPGVCPDRGGRLDRNLSEASGQSEVGLPAVCLCRRRHRPVRLWAVVGYAGGSETNLMLVAVAAETQGSDAGSYRAPLLSCCLKGDSLALAPAAIVAVGTSLLLRCGCQRKPRRYCQSVLGLGKPQNYCCTWSFFPIRYMHLVVRELKVSS